MPTEGINGIVHGQRRISADTALRLARYAQRIQAGMIHARKIVTVTADDRSLRLDANGETVAIVPRTTTREIHRYKACRQQGTPQWIR